jgi:predicted alpha/beta superfamily hydrolase
MSRLTTLILLPLSFVMAGRPTVVARSLSSDAPCDRGTTADSSLPRIETFDLESRVFGNSRTIRVCLPATYGQLGHEDQKYPVLYMNDGFAVFKSSLWNLPQIITNLRVAKKIPEIILVGIDNGATASGGSPDQRTDEYLPYPDTTNEPSVPIPHGGLYPDFLLKEVMPEVARRYRIKPGPDNTAIGGSSYGALAALYTVIHRPGIFGRLLLESTPTFIANDRIIQEASRIRNWPGRVYIGIGTNETSDEGLSSRAIPRAQQLKELVLRESQYTRVKLLIGQGDSHSSRSWSRRSPEALEFLFSAAN